LVRLAGWSVTGTREAEPIAASSEVAVFPELGSAVRVRVVRLLTVVRVEPVTSHVHVLAHQPVAAGALDLRPLGLARRAVRPFRDTGLLGAEHQSLVRLAGWSVTGTREAEPIAASSEVAVFPELGSAVRVRVVRLLTVVRVEPVTSHVHVLAHQPVAAGALDLRPLGLARRAV